MTIRPNDHCAYAHLPDIHVGSYALGGVIALRFWPIGPHGDASIRRFGGLVSEIFWVTATWAIQRVSADLEQAVEIETETSGPYVLHDDLECHVDARLRVSWSSRDVFHRTFETRRAGVESLCDFTDPENSYLP